MKMSKSLYITRSYDVNSFEVEEEEGRIKGHAAVFGQKVSIGNCFYESIERGAFDECDLSDVLLYINHGTQTIPLARARSSKSTMSVAVDEKGLLIDAELDIENNSEARAVYNSIKRGDLDGMSFAFFIKEQRWENLDTKMPTRVITKFKRVHEVSIVDRPAYSEAGVSLRSEDVKSALDEVKEARSTFNKSSESLELLKLKIKIKNMKVVK